MYFAASANLTSYFFFFTFSPHKHTHTLTFIVVKNTLPQLPRKQLAFSDNFPRPQVSKFCFSKNFSRPIRR